MPKVKLTDSKIRSIKAPEKGRVDYYDEGANGKLVLRVGTGGGKAWSCVYRVADAGGISQTGFGLLGPQQRLSLGKYPKVGLAEARAQAANVIEQAEKGIDPRHEKKAAVSARYTNTIRNLADRMLRMETHASVGRYAKLFDQHINPHIGDRVITDLRVEDINALLKIHIDNGREGTAREVRKMVRLLFGWAKQQRVEGFTDNFMVDYKHKGIVYRPRDRVLSNKELVTVWNAADQLHHVHGNIIRLLTLTGLRKSEVTQLKWSEIDRDQRAIHLSAQRSKTGVRIFAPLSDKAWSLLMDMKPYTEGDFVFSTTDGRSPTVLGSKVQKKLQGIVGFDDWTFHDLRRTFRTTLAILGVDRETAERAINHSQSRDQYNQYEAVEPRRDAANLFALHLEGLINEQT